MSTSKLKEISQEKAFLQTRWKALKDIKKEDESEEDKEEKSYITKRWKTLQTEEKDMTSMMEAPAAQSTGGESAIKNFAKTFERNKKSFGEVHLFLKDLSQEEKEEEDEDKEDEYDHSEENRHKAYYLGRLMEKAIGELLGGKSMDEAKGKHLLSTILIKHKDFNQLDEELNRSSVEHKDSGSKYPKDEKLQQFEDDYGLAKKKGIEFPELKKESAKVGTESKDNPSEVAKLGEDISWNPIEDGPSLARKKKDFPELEEEDRRLHLTKPEGPSHYHPGREQMQHFGCGGTIVKFLKTIAEAGVFLKSLAFEKAFGMGHRDIARRLSKAMDEPFMAEVESIFPGDLANLLQEEDEPEHKKKKDSKKDEKSLKTKDMPGTEMGMGGMNGEEDQDDLMGGGMDDLGGLEGLEGEEDQNPMDMGMGMKSLDILTQSAMKQMQTINEMNKSLNDLVAQIN